MRLRIKCFRLGKLGKDTPGSPGSSGSSSHIRQSNSQSGDDNINSDDSDNNCDENVVGTPTKKAKLVSYIDPDAGLSDDERDSGEH